jgi:mannosyltransferase OCH1-like enzyme
LEALYHYGGIYVDSDCEPYRSLEPLLGAHCFAAWEDRNTVPDAVIGAEPEHPVILEAIKLALKELPHGAWRSGPGVTTALLPNRPDVLLLPPGSFYPYHYTEKGRKLDAHKVDQPWAFMAHHWAGSWLDTHPESVDST